MINYFNYNYSNSKGKTNAGDTFNSSLNMGPSDAFYSSGLVKDHEVVLTNGTADLNWTPVKVGTFSVVTEDGKRGIADAFGNISGEVTGVITPAGTLTLAGVEKAKVTYRFDNNSVRADGYEAAGFTNVDRRVAAL